MEACGLRSVCASAEWADPGWLLTWCASWNPEILWIRAWAAAFTVSQIRICDSSMNRLVSICGLVIISTAPSSSARIPVVVPCSVRLLMITTGIGCWVIIFRRKVSPSIRGISTSRVITSGTSSAMYLAATKGSEAVPITSSSGSLSMIPLRVCRTTAESSTIRTLYLPMTDEKIQRKATATRV